MIALLALALLLGQAALPAPGDAIAFGGCSTSGSICAGPSVAVQLVSYGFRTQEFSAGAAPGLGYEVVFFADHWWRVGIELRASFLVGSAGSTGIFAAPVSFARYVRIGPSWSVTRGSGEWGLVGGLGLDVAALLARSP